MKTTPFTFHADDAALEDLRERLGRTRFPAPTPDEGWDRGTPGDYLRTMVDAWQAFDWRAVEARLNAHPQFLTEIDGQTIHYLHVRSARADATPLLLVHTYPGSVLDFLDLIEPLSADFHLVIPSLPGMGWSTPLSASDWTLGRTARAFDALMRGLGYDRYGAHGSDGGAMVGRELAMLAPDGFLGAHVLQLFSFPSGDPAEFEAMGPDDYAALEFAGWFQTVNGYADMNAKRPLTIGAALSDSPVGQLAYDELFENFGNGTSLVSRDQVLAQATLRWLTNTSSGAVMLHWLEKDVEARVNDGAIGLAVFAGDFQTIRPFAERDNTNIVSWTTHPRGGHFASLEVPEELATAVREFFAGRGA